MADQCLITVLASGNGSNFQALIDAVAAGQIPRSKIIQLLVNRKKAYAVERAGRAGIPSEYFNLIGHGFQKSGERDPDQIREARTRYDAALAQKVLGSSPRPQLIVLAGWMHIFSRAFLDPVKGAGIEIINLHPALPGRYDGADAIERAYEDFVAGKLENNRTGIMIHHVIDEVDRGDPIMTREIEVREGETLEEVKEKIHKHEHELIVEATAQVVRGILDGQQQSTTS